MDDDLMIMSLHELRQEVQKLRDAIRTHRDAASTSYAGTILNSGGCCRRRPIRCLQCRPGRSSFRDAYVTGSHWTGNCRTPVEQTTRQPGHEDRLRVMLEFHDRAR